MKANAFRSLDWSHYSYITVTGASSRAVDAPPFRNTPARPRLSSAAFDRRRTTSEPRRVRAIGARSLVDVSDDGRAASSSQSSEPYPRIDRVSPMNETRTTTDETFRAEIFFVDFFFNLAWNYKQLKQLSRHYIMFSFQITLLFPVG